MSKLKSKCLASSLKRDSLRAYRRAVIRLCNRVNKMTARTAKEKNNGFSSKPSIKELRNYRSKKLQFSSRAFNA